MITQSHAHRCALAFPTLAVDGTSQNTQGAVTTGQLAQTPADQPRLPVEKEATSSAPQSPTGMRPDNSKTSSKNSAAKRQLAKGQVDQQKAANHPPTAAMDRATPATSKTASAAKNTPTAAMDRATPDQKSP
jgi:hypothetical protein